MSSPCTVEQTLLGAPVRSGPSRVASELPPSERDTVCVFVFTTVGISSYMFESFMRSRLTAHKTYVHSSMDDPIAPPPSFMFLKRLTFHWSPAYFHFSSVGSGVHHHSRTAIKLGSSFHVACGLLRSTRARLYAAISRRLASSEYECSTTCTLTVGACTGWYVVHEQGA